MNFKEITLGDGTVTLISVDSTPNLIRRGVLTLTVEEEGQKVKKPIYIVELAEENGGGADIVSVYGIKANSNVVQKDYEEIIVKAGYKETTELAKVASKVLKARKGGVPQKRELRTKPPLFLAPVVESIGTFTNVVERGFFEREPDRFRMEDGKPYIQYGKNTGVFIGLNSIKWEKAYVNARELADRYITDKELWFDFGTKNQPQFKSETYGG